MTIGDEPKLDNTQALNEKSNKDIWRTWFKELGGIYWTVPEMMPKDAVDPLGAYFHYSGNPSLDPTGERKAKAAEEFKIATGFDAEAVYQFHFDLAKENRK